MNDTNICGVVLAGGPASSMSSVDRTLLEVGDQTILDRVLERIAPCCADVVLNANGDPSRFAMFGLPVIADDVRGIVGPLAGILAGMEWAHAQHPDAAWIATVPGDCPFLPFDLIPKLLEAARSSDAPIANAKSGEWRHPLAGVWRVSLREDLRRALGEGAHKVEVWAAEHGAAQAEWSDQPFDPFLSVNTMDDLEEADRIADEHPDI